VLLRTFNIYMLANQLPLLGLADIPTPLTDGERAARNSLQELIRARKAVSHNESRPFTIIAISDPNDLLSYPIPKGFGKSEETRDYQFINVITPIARKYALGTVAHPGKAHTGHADTPFVVDIIAHGHSGQ